MTLALTAASVISFTGSLTRHLPFGVAILAQQAGKARSLSCISVHLFGLPITTPVVGVSLVLDKTLMGQG